LYAIIDIETTGSRPSSDAITDIAIILHDGEKVTEVFETLLNPERDIPDFISQMTGITNAMVSTAPRFYEVAKKIVEMTEGCVFVAHNVRFDYTFVKQAFHDLGFNYSRKTLCTVRLSRKYLPGLASYSLGRLCSDIGITIQNRHRAMGDARATAELFTILFEKSCGKMPAQAFEYEIKQGILPPLLKKQDFDNLPSIAGVYFFYDENGNLLYIGKSKSLKDRILSHFRAEVGSGKHLEFKNKIASISWELSGSDVLAQLMESELIKKYAPPENKMLRKSKFKTGIGVYEDVNGYLRVFKSSGSKLKDPVILLPGDNEAKGLLLKGVQKYALCKKLVSLESGSGPCFDYHLNLCSGACIGEEDKEIYNSRVSAWLEGYHWESPDFYIPLPGRERNEKAFILIRENRLRGYGFIEQEAEVREAEELERYLIPAEDNLDNRMILFKWLHQNPGAAQLITSQ